jgi:hypothetical protein
MHWRELNKVWQRVHHLVLKCYRVYGNVSKD